MDPVRKTEVNGQTIKEYYWAGSHPCYVNGVLVEHSYDEAVRRAGAGEPLLQHPAYRSGSDPVRDALVASLTEMVEAYDSDDGGGPIPVIMRAKAALVAAGVV